MARQLGSFGITGVQSGRGSNGSIPTRKEIRELQQDADQWNLYLLGLERFQGVDQSQLLSYYQIAGIHGRPFVDWDNVGPAPNMQNSGYCTHTSILFPTWHRPYLALYEQVLYNTVQEIANEFSGADREKYVRAAATFRIPYWDWAAAPPGGQSVLPPSVGGSSTVSVTSPQGQRTIPNPLFQYTFHPLNTNELPDAPLSSWNSTLRYPTSNRADATSRNNLVAQQLDNSRLSIRDRIYNLFSNSRNYTEFSNKAWFPSDGGNYDSIESVHDQIHGLVGSGGHMSYVPYSAFDPIFWLHHAMVDRVFAIWQVLNPDSYVTPQSTAFGTYTIARDTIEDANTNLAPFHSNGQGGFWTSNSVKSIQDFGYTYPELTAGNGSSTDLVSRVRARVNELYGQTAPANVVQRRGNGGSRNPRNSRNRLVARANLTDPSPVDTPSGLVEPDDTYNEYIVNIRVKKAALEGSFFVHVFLGEFSNDPFCWSFEANLVGTHCVFADAPGGECDDCKDPEARNAFVTGVIPITTALLNAIKRGKLASLDPNDVDPYLKRNLAWRVTTLNDGAVDNNKVDGLKVSVVSAEVKRPQTITELPKWGDFTIREGVTQNRTTGQKPSDPI
jgi:tyrosinase